MSSLVHSGLAYNPRCFSGPATLGTFVLGNRPGPCVSQEWGAHLTEDADVVVAAADGVPSPTGIAKAVSIIQSRNYLETRAIQLLLPFTKEAGSWKLVTLVFGAQADLFE